MMSVLFLLLFLAPVGALLWLVVASHSRMPKRIGAAAAAMATVVGALTMPPFSPDELANYHVTNVRDATAILAAASGSIYLMLWTRLHHGRGRNRTLATIAAIIGFVPIFAAIAAAVYAAGVSG